MSRYQVEAIVITHHYITVSADDEHEALKLAEQGVGDCESSAPEITFKPPKRLGDVDG